MKTNEILKAIAAGVPVYWKSRGYKVIDGGKAGTLIQGPGGHCVGLFKDSGAMVTGYKEADFFTGPEEAAPLFPPPGLIGQRVYKVNEEGRISAGKIIKATKDSRGGVGVVDIEFGGGTVRAFYDGIGKEAYKGKGAFTLSFVEPRPAYLETVKVIRAGAEFFIKAAEYPRYSYTVKARTTGELSDINATAPEVKKVAREAFPGNQIGEPSVMDCFGLYVVVKVWAAGCLPAAELK